MKLVKKIVMGAAVAITAAGLAVAQSSPMPLEATEDLSPQSMTSISTAELFGNDVDDFMNVNEYQNVEPEHLFGYLGFGKTGSGTVQLGLAHQFNKFYLGGWFGGSLNTWSITKDKDESASKNKTTTQHDTDYAAYGKVLFGINNMGILANFAFQPNKNNNQYEDDKENKSKTTLNNFNINTSVKFGINLNGKNDKVYKTWAELGLNSRVAKKEVKTDDNTKTNDNSIYRLVLNGGTSFDVYDANDITQTIDLELDTGWDIYAITVYKDKDGHLDQTGAFGMELAFKPAWTLAYEPEESKFGFKTKVGLESTFKYKQNPDKFKPSSGSATYKTSRTYKPEMELKPTWSVGAIYRVVPEKFQLNGGLALSAFNEWQETKTETRDSSDGKVTSTKEEGTWKFDVSKAEFALKSGFTWTPSDKVTVDANWDILNAVFGKNFRSGFQETDTTTGSNFERFWGNVNTLVFQNFGFLVSVKL